MSWIETYTNRKVDPFNMTDDDINIHDIAHSLSMLCRFNGHCREFYSVADHSVRCLDLFKKYVEQGKFINKHGVATYSVNHKAYLYVLLHDAEEAYTSDLPRPIKRTLPEYMDACDSVSEAVFRKFGIKPDERLISMLKHIDSQMLATEARDLGLNFDNDWDSMPDPLPQVVVPRTQQESKREFMKAFDRIQFAETSNLNA